MIITAKYNSTCPCCAKYISAGEKVEWVKGEKAKHVACTGPSVASSAPRSYTVRSRARFTRCEGWGSDNPHAPRAGHCADCAAMG